MKKNIVVLTSGLVCFLATIPLLAQPIWLDQTHHRVIALEVYKPKKDNTKFFTSVVFLSARLGISGNLVFVAELPLAFAGFDFKAPARDSSDNKIGNPYFGVELLRKDSPLFFEAGVRLPLVHSSNFATIIGQLTDADRFEAFSPDAMTLMATANLHSPPNSPLWFRLRFGPSILVSTGEGKSEFLISGEDSEFFLLFSGQTGIDFPKVFLGAGLTGRLVVTEDRNIGRRTFLQLGANLRFKLGRFRPGLHFRVPLEDDLKEVLDWVGGASLGFHFR
jgi:hypothetical protein